MRRPVSVVYLTLGVRRRVAAVQAVRGLVGSGARVDLITADRELAETFRPAAGLRVLLVGVPRGPRRAVPLRLAAAARRRVRRRILAEPVDVLVAGDAQAIPTVWRVSRTHRWLPVALDLDQADLDGRAWLEGLLPADRAWLPADGWGSRAVDAAGGGSRG